MKKINEGFVEIIVALGVFVLMIYGLFAGIKWLKTPRPPQPPCKIITEKIISIGDTTNIEGGGGFFIFAGIASVGENEYFYYYTETEGSYQLKKVENSDKVFIHEGEEHDPRVEKENSRECGFSHERETRFYIPTNSIKRGFNLDLPK